MSTFEYPPEWAFPPFFTLQPNQTTLEKQLSLWRSLIHRYYTQNKESILVIHDCPLFKNDAISRELSQDDARTVVKDFVKGCYGEWVDDEDGEGAVGGRCRVLWRTPQQLAGDIYEWASRSGYIKEVVTIYEINNGEETKEEGFAGIGEELVRQALEILEERGKAAVFHGSSSDEDGVKFL